MSCRGKLLNNLIVLIFMNHCCHVKFFLDPSFRVIGRLLAKVCQSWRLVWVTAVAAAVVAWLRLVLRLRVVWLRFFTLLDFPLITFILSVYYISL